MNQHPQHSNKRDRHWLLMVLCCLAVITAIIILPKYFNIGALGFILLILLCPVLHYFMMRKMQRSKNKPSSRSSTGFSGRKSNIA